jgi:hypothetical protein
VTIIRPRLIDFHDLTFTQESEAEREKVLDAHRKFVAVTRRQ